MKCKEIFDSALRLLTSVNDPGSAEIYTSRLPYLLACFVGECYPMDASYRARQAAAGGQVFPETFEAVSLEETEDFPMSPRFLPAAAYYLASMLILRENEGFSEALYERYRDALSHIRAGIPMKLTPIANRYR